MKVKHPYGSNAIRLDARRWCAVVVAVLVLLSTGLTIWFLRSNTDAGPVLEILLALAVAVPVFAIGTFALRPHGFESTVDTLRRGLRSRWSRMRR